MHMKIPIVFIHFGSFDDFMTHTKYISWPLVYDGEGNNISIKIRL